MTEIKLKTASQIIPMIYAYSTPEIKRHDGWVKIGYTEKDVEKRIKEQTQTADVKYIEEWRGNAIFEDGSGKTFKDKEFHVYLRKYGVKNDKTNEWFKISGKKSENCFHKFRKDHGILKKLGGISPYTLRKEQTIAIRQTKDYYDFHRGGEFLWNAKPRFGKTLSVYDFCKKINAENVLVVTNRPAIANSWYDDYVKFLGEESGYKFVSHTDVLKNESCVITNEQFTNDLPTDKKYKRIEFVSLQDLKGSMYFGGEHDKLEHIKTQNWDLLVIDEAHEGVDTYKTDVAFDQIKRDFTIHLSGTPFKALANEKFPQEAIYNWTYADEQQAKRDWKGEIGDRNPYQELPKLNLYTYQMSEIIKDELSQGIEIDGEKVKYAFDLNLFFETNNKGKFIHESSVDKFLDALTTQKKYPFSTEELRNELKHTFWLLNRVDSAKALARKLNQHPIFKDYEIVLAAGDGILSEEDESLNSFVKVKKAIKKYPKTITLSVGQLTTGVTIPELSGVLMLSSMKSPSLYMQAAFRSQNPWMYSENGKYYRKENAYVFDFDPARTLTIFEKFANDLSADTADGKGDIDARKQNIRKLLNFFPVIGEDTNGEMIELDAEKVLSIPRKIKSLEVVRRGFMSDFLFQNISNVFHAPNEVINILEKLTPTAEPKGYIGITPETENELSLDKNGEVLLNDEIVKDKTLDIFGDVIYGDEDDPYKFLDIISESENNYSKNSKTDNELDELKAAINERLTDVVVMPIINTAKDHYGSEMRPSDRNKIEKKMKMNKSKIVETACGNYKIHINILEKEKEKKLSVCTSEDERLEINNEFENKTKNAVQDFKDEINTSINDFISDSTDDIVRTIETSKKEQEKKGYEDKVRDYLRGFSRTIPSFLMAYGNENTTLANFEENIPQDVFEEVTSITIDEFKFLRDGGKYTNEITGKPDTFDGKLFDQVVFDDSIKEFLSLRKKLANYFDESNKEDIFDYIPPQKTNQIFTPKWVVKKMADALEEENPGCFDNPDNTFLDPYMKSGLYITEIVKRLYRSQNMKKLFPDENERLNHIFEKQVYGLAPTKIIYRIAKQYILGFDNDQHKIMKHNFKMLDSLEYVKAGTLDEKLNEIYNENMNTQAYKK